MRKGKIYITLKSDLCVGDGSTFNSLIDTDVCQDNYGIPFIPAKRLRGCLRECAIELSDWGMEIKANDLFGGEGNQRARVRIGNALIKGYDTYAGEIEANRGHMLFHPQNVLDQFSYLRTQTAINNETGAADPTSLRTIRVINKGEVFISEVEITDDGLPDAATIVRQLTDCCLILRHMGIARTRGYGEVAVWFTEEKADEGEDKGINNLHETLSVGAEASASPNEAAKRHEPLLDGAEELTYTIELLEPMILKSANGEEENTQDYIEGSKVLGLVAQAMNEKKEDVAGFFSGDALFFSNAYISREGVRPTEAPAVFYDVKNHKDQYRNKLYDSQENRDRYDQSLQLNQMKHSYVLTEENGNIRKLDVDVEERYHHRRPADKSIGRAAAKVEANAHFYQISSISPGQTFAGRILGTPDQIRRIYDILSQKDYVYMGYGRSSEYGLARIRITGTDKKNPDLTVTGHDLAVLLKAPTIVYSENASYSINSEDLIEEIYAALGVKSTDSEAVTEELPAAQDAAASDKAASEARPDAPVWPLSVSAKYLKYVLSGGFNVTWGKRKPTIDAFGAGTVITFHSEEALQLTVPAVLRLGERTREGFGEAVVWQFNPQDADRYVGAVISDDPAGGGDTVLDVQHYPFAEKIGVKLFESYIRSEAAREAAIYIKKQDKDKIKPTISNLMLMNKELLADQTQAGTSAPDEKTAKELSQEQEEKCAYNRISAIARERYGTNTERKKEKLKVAADLLKRTNGKSKDLKEQFSAAYHLVNFVYDEDQLFLRYLEAFLTHGKYMLHDIVDEDREAGKETSDEQ